MDFGPKSNVIKTSLGFQFPTKLIQYPNVTMASSGGFFPRTLTSSMDIPENHMHPWKQKTHETSTWTGFLWNERTPFGGIISFHVVISREETYAYTM